MNTEIEARFLNIDKPKLVEKLLSLGATDSGEDVLSEVIFYNADKSWLDEGRRVRLRSGKAGTELTYKQNTHQTIDAATEIEFTVPSSEKAELFLEAIGLKAFRRQEKRRHTLTLQGVTIDIDTWPKIPPYAEFEGSSEDEIRHVAELLGFKWKDVVFDDARQIIQKHYGVAYDNLRWFTFERCE